MKKSLLMFFLLGTLSTYTIVQGNNFDDEVKITVIAEKKTTFDMFHSAKGELKGLTTPYEMKFPRTDSQFIFRSKKAKTKLKIKVEVNDNTALTADWPITVLLITNGSMTTFGME